MKNVRIAFDTYDGNIDDLVGYQFVKDHVTFDKLVPNRSYISPS